MTDKKRLEVLLSWRSTTYMEGVKMLDKYKTLYEAELEAMADLLGFEFERHDCRTREEIIKAECPKKHQAKLLDRKETF